MPLLQVRDFPQDLYDKLGRAAKSDRRSIAQQTTVLLRETLGAPESATARRQQALARASQLAQTTPPNDLDPAELIRKDRDR